MFGKSLLQIGTLAALAAAAALTGCSDDKHEERLRTAGPHPTLDALLKVANAGAGQRKFDQCAACHTIGEGAPDTGGPNLFGIYGQPMGQKSQRFGYTAALRDAGGRWDAAALDAWIADPKKFIPGTNMQFGGVADPLDRADIIAYLQSQSREREGRPLR